MPIYLQIQIVDDTGHKILWSERRALPGFSFKEPPPRPVFTPPEGIDDLVEPIQQRGPIHVRPPQRQPEPIPLPPEPTGPKPQPKKFGMDAWAQVRMHAKDDRDADWIAKELGLDRQHVCYAMLSDKYSKYSHAADRADTEELHRWRNGKTTT